MTTRNLATAFNAALTRIDHAAPTPVAVAGSAAADHSVANQSVAGHAVAGPAPSGDTLIDALRCSATDCDQIVLRRIGLMSAALAASS